MSLNCNIIQDLLPSYVDEVTSEMSNEQIREHIEQCTECKREYELLKLSIVEDNNTLEEPSSDVEKKLVKRIKSKLITIVISVMATFLMLGIVVGALGNVLFQEGNPLAVASAIVKLEVTNSEYEKISGSNQKYIASFEGNGARELKLYMKEKGWKFKEQFGSGYMFQKDDRTITVGTRKFTKRYYVWLIPEQATAVEEK
jgi:hypothetical protein